MRLLLDTHTFIWYVDSPERLPSLVVQNIADSRNDVFFSIASAWEMSIKTSIGRLTLSKPAHLLVAEQLQLNNFELINIELADLALVGSMPRHHGDPFDRVLVAQAIARSLTIASIDDKLDRYGIKRLW